MASSSKKVMVTDLVLRDAHQSLLATRMRTEDMLPICDKLDKVGYWSLESWGGANFDGCLRYLKGDKHAPGAICYTTSPVHTIEHFVEIAREMEKMGCQSIAIKDMAGLITPARTVELYQALSKAVNVAA